MNRIGDSLQHTGSNAELVHSLAASGVEFILVGGLAVAWYCTERVADDMDLLVNPTHENSRRIFGALAGLRLQGFTETSFTRVGLQVPLKQYFYAELLTPHSEGPSYSEALVGAETARLFNVDIQVASRLVLIRMKELAAASPEAQQDKHVQDIQRLRGRVARA